MVIELEIPEIDTVVIYTDNSLSIKLPYELFSGNTEGQCGKFMKTFPQSNGEMLHLKQQRGSSSFISTLLFFQEPVTTPNQMTVGLQMANWKTAKTLQTSGQLMSVFPQRLSLLHQPPSPQPCQRPPAFLPSVTCCSAGESRERPNVM